jgi:hypothetical protein
MASPILPGGALRKAFSTASERALRREAPAFLGGTTFFPINQPFTNTARIGNIPEISNTGSGLGHGNRNLKHPQAAP